METEKTMPILTKDYYKKGKSYLTYNWFYTMLGGVFFSLFALFAAVGKLELLPTTFFSTTTALFSYLAYKFSKEKFRLDLFEKRWIIYEHALNFCSVVTQQGSLRATDTNREAIIRAVTSADNSFRGIGWHKTRALFDTDIHELFAELNRAYAWFATYTERPPVGTPAEQTWPKDMYDKSMFVYNTATNLPDLFKPYMYFGDYKRD